jgi:tetratricopeptide (TPR) repeat protein
MKNRFLGIICLSTALILIATANPLSAGTTVSGHVKDKDGNPVQDMQIVLVGEEEIKSARAMAGGGQESVGGRVSASSTVSAHEDAESRGKVGRTYKAKTNRKGAYVFMVNSGGYMISIEDEALAIDHVSVQMVDQKREPVLDWEGRIPPGQAPPRLVFESGHKVTVEIVVAPKDQLAKDYSAILLGTIARALEQGDRETAMQTVENLLETSPNDPLGLTLRAYILIEEGKFEPAEADLTEALAQEPGMYDAQYQLASLYRQTSREQEALQLFRTSAEGAPDDEQMAKALLNVGELERQAGNKEKAIEALEAAVEAFPGLAVQVSPELAALYVDLGDTAKAEELLSTQDSDGPVDPAVHYNIAVSHFNRRDWEAAIDAFRKVIEADPEFADAYRNLGYSLLNLGETKAALDSFRKFIELKPEGADADEVRPLVDALSQATQ